MFNSDIRLMKNYNDIFNLIGGELCSKYKNTKYEELLSDLDYESYLELPEDIKEVINKRIKLHLMKPNYEFDKIVKKLDKNKFNGSLKSFLNYGQKLKNKLSNNEGKKSFKTKAKNTANGVKKSINMGKKGLRATKNAVFGVGSAVLVPKIAGLVGLGGTGATLIGLAAGTLFGVACASNVIDIVNDAKEIKGSNKNNKKNKKVKRNRKVKTNNKKIKKVMKVTRTKKGNNTNNRNIDLRSKYLNKNNLSEDIFDIKDNIEDNKHDEEIIKPIDDVIQDNNEEVKPIVQDDDKINEQLNETNIVEDGETMLNDVVQDSTDEINSLSDSVVEEDKETDLVDNNNDEIDETSIVEDDESILDEMIQDNMEISFDRRKKDLNLETKNNELNLSEDKLNIPEIRNIVSKLEEMELTVELLTEHYNEGKQKLNSVMEKYNLSFKDLYRKDAYNRLEKRCMEARIELEKIEQLIYIGNIWISNIKNNLIPNVCKAYDLFEKERNQEDFAKKVKELDDATTIIRNGIHDFDEKVESYVGKVKHL